MEKQVLRVTRRSLGSLGVADTRYHLVCSVRLGASLSLQLQGIRGTVVAETDAFNGHWGSHFRVLVALGGNEVHR